MECDVIFVRVRGRGDRRWGLGRLRAAEAARSEQLGRLVQRVERGLRAAGRVRDRV